MEIVEPPRSIAKNTSHESHPIEGELVRRQGEIFKIPVDSEWIRGLIDLM